MADILYSIYVLIDPRDGAIRYVGITKLPIEERRQKHIYEAKKGNKGHRFNWIRQLVLIDLEPKILEICKTFDVEYETFWILKLSSLGHRLTNECKGGYAFCGMKGKKHSEETKIKMSLAQKGHPGHRLGMITSEETRRKQSEALKGRKVPKEQAVAAGIGMKKKWADPEYKEKMIEIRKRQGKIASDTKQNSQAMKKMWSDPEFKAKMAIIRKEQGLRRRGNVSEETRRKMSVGISAAKQKKKEVNPCQ